VGTFVADQRPYVLLTSNNTRDLAAGLKRRCLHLFLDYPAAERELEIVKSKKTGLSEALAEELVNVVRGVPDAGHGHGYEHGHGGHAEHSRGGSHDADDPSDRDGRAVRAARDRAGRHGEGVYVDSVRSARPAEENTAPKSRDVTSSQGSRSFGLGRKRAL
jgi:hypothetical protein